jgi:acylphosphatase
MKICKRCQVKGRVQGVFYRASTQEQAEKYNVTGYVRNLPDGSVEVLACGEERTVEALCSWLWQGPFHAKVDSVECVASQQTAPERFTTE